MTRLENWDAGVVELAREVIGLPVEYGRSDCASIARRTVRAIYGDDAYLELGDYASGPELVDVVTAQGGTRAILDRVAVPVSSRYLRTGDLISSPPEHCALELGAVMLVVRGRAVLVEDGRVRSVRLGEVAFPPCEGWRLRDDAAGS